VRRLKPWHLGQVNPKNKKQFLKTLKEIRNERKLTPGEEAILAEFEEKENS